MTVEVSGVTNLVVRYKLLIVIFAMSYGKDDNYYPHSGMANIIITGAVIMTTMVFIVKEFFVIITAWLSSKTRSPPTPKS